MKMRNLLFNPTFNSLYGIQASALKFYKPPQILSIPFMGFKTRNSHIYNEKLTFNSLYGIQTSFSKLSYFKILTFQFPLWDSTQIITSISLTKISFNSLYGIHLNNFLTSHDEIPFQFPLWDSNIILLSILNLDFILSIPFMGFSEFEGYLDATFYTFNSLYGIQQQVH